MLPRQQASSALAIAPRARNAVRTIRGKVTTLALLLWLAPSVSWAAGSGMPWEAPLQRILDSVQGPVAKIVAERRMLECSDEQLATCAIRPSPRSS